MTCPTTSRTVHPSHGVGASHRGTARSRMAAKSSARPEKCLCGLGHATTFADPLSPALVIIRHMVRPRDVRAVDPIDRAHLTGVTRPSPPIHRYAASPHLVDLVERYWIPVWSLTEPSTQSTLQHPVCLIVVSNTYARFYGVTHGRSSVTLEGDGWAVGTMLQPAAGRLLARRSVAELTDTHVDLDEIAGLDAGGLVAEIRAAMTPDPGDPAGHARGDRGGRAAARGVRPGGRARPDDQRAGDVAARPPRGDPGRRARLPRRPQRAQPPAARRAACRDEPEVADPASPAARRCRGAQGGGGARWPTWRPAWDTPTRPTSPTTSGP